MPLPEEWAKPGDPEPAPGAPPVPHMKQLALDYERLTEAKKTIEGLLEANVKEIASHFPDEPGEFSHPVDDITITVKRSEKWEWDSEALERAFPTGSVPDYVRRKLSVRRKDYESLPAGEQSTLKPALTRGVGTARVSVSRNTPKS